VTADTLWTAIQADYASRNNMPMAGFRIWFPQVRPSLEPGVFILTGRHHLAAHWVERHYRKGMEEVLQREAPGTALVIKGPVESWPRPVPPTAKMKKWLSTRD